MVTMNTLHQTHPPFRSHPNSAVMLLPYPGDQELADSFNWSASVMAPENEGPRSADLAMMKCPLDPHKRTDNGYRMTAADATVYATFARGNCGGNCGASELYYSLGMPSCSAPGGTTVKTVCIGDQIIRQQWENGA